MTISAEIAQIEAELSLSGQTIKALCVEANVNQSTWTRWKAGTNEPNMKTWGKVREAFRQMTSGQPEQGAA